MRGYPIIPFGNIIHIGPKELPAKRIVLLVWKWRAMLQIQKHSQRNLHYRDIHLIIHHLQACKFGTKTCLCSTWHRYGIPILYLLTHLRRARWMQEHQVISSPWEHTSNDGWASYTCSLPHRGLCCPLQAVWHHCAPLPHWPWCCLFSFFIYLERISPILLLICFFVVSWSPSDKATYSVPVPHGTGGHYRTHEICF